MIAVRLNLGSVQAARRTSRHAQAIGTLFDLRSHAAKIFRQRRNAVALLHAQFRRVSNLDSVLGERAEHCDGGQLIDQLGNEVAFDDASLERLMADGEVSNEFAVGAAYRNQTDWRSHGAKNVKHSRARGIQSHVVNDHIRFGKHHSRRQEKYCG